MPLHHRQVAFRIALVSLLLAVLASPLAWLVAQEQAEEGIVALAMEDSRRLVQHFAAQAQPALSAGQQAEQAAVEYVVLDIDSVRAGITLNEDDLRTYYKENVARLAGKEERRASHILINALKDAPAADREKAKARATQLLEQVRKAPATFAEVAKKSSEDTGSAAAGGDLNFFGLGAMVKPFEDAAFAMKKGGYQ